MNLSVTAGTAANAPPTVDPGVTAASANDAIMAEMLSGDMGVAAVLGSLRNDVPVIAKLLTTFPKNLGQNMDMAA